MKKLIKFSSPLVLVFLCVLSLELIPAKVFNSLVKTKAKVVTPKPEPILYFEINYEGVLLEFSGVGATSGRVSSFVGYEINGNKGTEGTVSGTFSSSGPGDFSVNVSGNYTYDDATTDFNYNGPAEESTTPFF